MENRPRILFLANIPSPYRADFFEELGKNLDLTVLYETDRALDRDEKWLNKQAGASYKRIFLKSRFRLSSSAFCPEVTSYLDPSKYDLIVVGVYSTPTGMYAISYMKRHKIPYVINCDGGMPGGTKGFKAWLKRHFLSGAEGYLSTGSLCDQYLTCYGAEPSKIFRYPFTSIRRERLCKEVPSAEEKRELREKLGLLSGKKVILSVGQFIPRKGYDLLIKAAGKLKEAGLDEQVSYRIIGGEELPEYREERTRMGISDMAFLPFMDSETLRDYYLAADLFVLPTREDIWGLVINEAMAAGLPVITTDACVAGMEMLPHKQQTIIPAEDIDALTDALESFLKSDVIWQNAGEENLRASEHFTIEEMARVHVDIFRQILSTRGKRILFVGTMVPDELEARAEGISAAGNRFQNNLIRNLGKAGYEVDTLSFLGSPLKEEQKAALLRGDYGPWKGVVATGGIKGKIASIRHFAKVCRTLLCDKDYVVCYNILYAWLTLPKCAKREKSKSIAIIADYSGAECFRSLPRKLYAMVMKASFRRFDTVVGLSKKISPMLRKEQKFVLMEGGIDRALYDYFQDPPRQDNTTCTILYAGLLEQVTGIDLLLSAVNMLPASFPVRILFTGKGSMMDAVKEAAASDPRISYLGHLPYEEYLEVIKGADILINPRNMNLPENRNNFPSKILEYLCSGKPVISTRFIGHEKFPQFFYCGSSPEEIKAMLTEADKLLPQKQELYDQSRKQ